MVKIYAFSGFRQPTFLAFLLAAHTLFGMTEKKLIEATINRFICAIGYVQSEYTAYPYFATPDNRLERYLSTLLSFRECLEYRDDEVQDLFAAMETTKAFLAERIPATAIHKASYIEKLDTEYLRLKARLSRGLVHSR